MASAKRRPKPAAPRLTEEERAAKVEALMDRLASAVSALTEGEQWTAMLRTAAKFHRYSFRNMMLLWAQAEERGMALTAVAGFSTWRTLGRSVRRGERGLAILAPVTRRAGDEPARGVEEPGGERVMCGVRVVHVFDLAQTDGTPLPDPPRPRELLVEDVAGLWDRLAALVHAEGYAVQRNPEDGARQGWTNYTDRVVSVRPDLGSGSAAAVLAHELGHIRADHEHRDISRAQKETEAESIAYVVMTASGLDSAASAVPYVAGWSGGDPAVIAAAAETVHTAAAGILGDLVADDGPAPSTAAPAARVARATLPQNRHAATAPGAHRPGGPPRLDGNRSQSR